MQQTDITTRLAGACGVPQECVTCTASESGYRRSVTQGLSLASDLVRAGGTAGDLNELADLAAEWRCGGEPHPVYLDELLSAWRAGKRGDTIAQQKSLDEE